MAADGDPSPPTVALPTPPEQPRLPTFPLLMAVAPVLVAVVLWQVTGSAFVLVFAALAPVMAIASYVDARRQARRAAAAELSRYARDLLAFEAEGAAALLERRAALLATSPDAGELLKSGGSGGVVSGSAPLSLGIGAVPSGVVVQGAQRDLQAETRAVLDELRVLAEAPVTTSSTRIRITGPEHLALAASRGVIVQAIARGEGSLTVSAGPLGQQLREEVLALGLDCTQGRVVADGLELDRSAAEVSRERRAQAAGLARLHVRSVLHADLDAGPRGTLALLPSLVTRAELRAFSEGRGARARAGQDELPARVGLLELLTETSRESAQLDGLTTALGVCALGTVMIDLARDGPHALVSGETGSGKSELLRSWALGMTSERTTRQVLVLCFDFKGGATFDSLAGLPHCVGVLTDLDRDEARRAAESLMAELRDREAALREPPRPDRAPMPRLVIFVDEYQALLDASADLHAVFCDLAARGRSLGMHLVLGSQRAAAAARDGITANCAIRVCFRVATAAESTAVVGTDEAARIPSRAKGRAVLVTGGTTRLLQVAHASAAEARSLLVDAVSREEHQRTPPPRRPWLPPLPRLLDLAALPVGAHERSILFGVCDRPEDRQRDPLEFDPSAGALSIVGGPRSGKSSTLRALQRAAERTGRAATILAPEPEHAWDVLFGPRELCGLLLVDDLDVLLARFDEPHRQLAIDRLIELTRTAGRRTPGLALATQRVSGSGAAVVANATSTLLLGHANRSGYVLAGGEARHFVSSRIPGRGRWNGVECQVALVPETADAELPRRPVVRRGDLEESVVVARRPDALSAGLRGLGLEVAILERGAAQRHDAAAPPRTVGSVLVGDLDSWQACYGLLPRLAARHSVVFAGITANEHRSLLRGDATPPFVVDPVRSLVVRSVDGSMRAMTWP